MSEKNLISKAKQGDVAAFEQLIEQYQSKVYNLAYKMLNNYEDASDAAQDALIKIYKSISSFKEQSLFSTWVYRLTYNVCIDRLRQRKNVSKFEQLDEAMADKSNTPDIVTENNERLETIHKAINSLSQEHKAVVVLRDVNGHSYEEIADILGCSIGTVKSRINRARSNLKEILSDYLEQNMQTNRQKDREGR